MKRLLLGCLAGVAMASLAAVAQAADEFIVVQSTTSTQNSGLYEYLLPIYEKKSGVEVRVVAVGTGQAIKNAMNGDGDVLLVHAKSAEEKFVADGFGVKRFDLMYNDFVVVGPAADPAGIAGSSDIVSALGTIAEGGNIFVSRGDDSGTHKKELSLWREARIEPASASGGWYLESGSGMGATLNIAVGMDGYTLTDRATWISFGNKQDYDVVVEGDPNLFNQYGVILINPEVCPNANSTDGQIFIDWLLSDTGQDAISAHQIDGQQLFFPNAPGLD